MAFLNDEMCLQRVIKKTPKIKYLESDHFAWFYPKQTGAEVFAKFFLYVGHKFGKGIAYMCLEHVSQMWAMT